jgi:signal transduction histidine kinase
VPQVIVVLDEDARVLEIESSRAGSSFTRLSSSEPTRLHTQLHPGCKGDCRFSDLWNKAWEGLSSRRSIEWEIDDHQLNKLLRLNLIRPPTSTVIKKDRRRRRAWLTLTDITKHRREYQSLIEREQALTAMVAEQVAVHSDSAKNAPIENGTMPLFTENGRSLRAISRDTILAEENERKRIAAELHDSVAQSLGAVKYQVEASVMRLSSSYPEFDIGPFERVVTEIRGVLDEVRRISENLAPPVLDKFGLCIAVDWLCDEFRSNNRDLQVICETSADENDLPESMKVAIFRIIQESLNNVAKHSLARKAEVCLGMVDDGLHLSISDDGVGFDPAKVNHYLRPAAGGSGLRNMRDRILATGGKYSIDSAPRKGVKISASWPRYSNYLAS